ncbi:MAG: ribonuclease HII [Myxococcota bacterium]
MAERISIAKLTERVTQMRDDELDELAADSRRGVSVLLRRERRRREALANEKRRLEDMLTHERELWSKGRIVAGVDEVGVGPLAGPVMAAAVVLPSGCSVSGIDDSKQLDRSTRESLAATVRECALAWSLGTCDRHEIDRMNIYQAAREAMRRAVIGLSHRIDALLVDARTVPGVDLLQRPIIKGDQHSQSIAAASIVAKVERDAWMREAASRYPGYGFESHKGYYCPQHLEALARLGPCALHRRSFSPVAAQCSSQELEALDAIRSDERQARPPEPQIGLF